MLGLDFSTELILTVGTVVVVGYLLSRRRNKIKNIPGPRGLPFIGNAFQLESDQLLLTLSKWAAEYGDIVKITLFGEDIVVVNSCEGIKEMLVTKSTDFADRPYLYRLKSFYNEHGVAIGNFTPKWSLIKKHCMMGIKQVGEQLTELEELVMDYMNEFTTILSSYSISRESINLLNDIETVIACITFTLVYGHKLSLKEHKDYMEVNANVNQRTGPGAYNKELDIMPWLRGPWNAKYRDLQRMAMSAKHFFRSHLVKTMSRHQDNEISCALDGLINEMKHPSTNKFSPVSTGNIQDVALDLTQGGIITTVTTLYYFFALMAAKPKIQERVYEYIMEVIGQRQVTLQDRFRIPFIESMMLEIIRLQSNVALGIPHAATTDTSVCGYDIPKGTQVWPNLWNLHHDPKRWDGPWEFKPDRFLDDQGNLITADHPLRKQFYGFGAGRRVCPGEVMAKNRTFLFIVTILQRFKLVQPENETIDIDPRRFKYGFTLFPDNFKVRVQSRV